MSLQKSLALLLAACLSHWMGSDPSWGANRPEQTSLVNVRLNADFHPELDFRIAEALQRPPLEWNVVRDHTFAEISEPLPYENNADKIIAGWEQLVINNPANFIPRTETPAVAATPQVLEEMVAKIQTFVQKNFAFIAPGSADFSLQIHPADLISLSDLPQLHTGESIMAGMTSDVAPFTLDPYGYDEYNGYFEPEIYDWFVFVTDDLTVVYVHENSDVMPTRLVDAELTPEEDEMVGAMPESVQIAVRESVRAVLSGEVRVMDVVDQTRTALSGLTKPIWTHYVTENELLRAERVAQLRELLRF